MAGKKSGRKMVTVKDPKTGKKKQRLQTTGPAKVTANMISGALFGGLTERAVKSLKKKRN